MKLKSIIVINAVVVLSILTGLSAMAETNGGQTAAEFLRIGVGASAAGMGGAYTAQADGAVASYWNPANLAWTEFNEVSASHMALYQTLNLENGAAAFKLDEKTGLGLSVTYMGYGSISGYNALGESVEGVSAYDLAGGLSVGRQITESVALGITAKVIYQVVDDLSAATAAFDLGISGQWRGVSLAGVVANLGPGLKFDTESEPLPTSFRIAAAGNLFHPSLLAAIETEKKLDGDIVIRQGFEYNFMDDYFVRTGHQMTPGDDARSFGSAMAFGAGAVYNGLRIDYAFVLGEKYSSDGLHRFSFTYAIGR